MAKRTKPQHGDRITNTTTGETGTIIDVHDGTQSRKRVTHEVHYSVLRDRGPRMNVRWRDDEAEWSFPERGCQRCGAKNHKPPACPAGDLSSGPS